MSVISVFSGIMIRMFFRDIERHHCPHLHADYQGMVGVYSIPDGKLIAGSLPTGKHKLVTKWIVLHKDDLLIDWELAAEGKNLIPVKGLEK